MQGRHEPAIRLTFAGSGCTPAAASRCAQSTAERALVGATGVQHVALFGDASRHAAPFRRMPAARRRRAKQTAVTVSGGAMNHVFTPARRAVLRVATVAAVSAAGATWMALVAHPACAADATDFEAAFASFQRAAAGDTAPIEPAAKQFEALPKPTRRPGAAGLRRRDHRDAGARRGAAMEEDGLRRRRPGALDKALALLSPRTTRRCSAARRPARECASSPPTHFSPCRRFMNRAARGSGCSRRCCKARCSPRHRCRFSGTVWLRAGWPRPPTTAPADARRWFEQVVASGAPQAGAAQAKLKGWHRERRPAVSNCAACTRPIASAST